MAQPPESESDAQSEEASTLRLNALVAPIAAEVEAWLRTRADHWRGAPPLPEAMRYALLQGGKRIRPVIVVASCEAVGGDRGQASAAACAVEMVHAYSLVHDDLPAMDDDDLRRGLPTLHRRWDEATAILAGDALLTAAFSSLADASLAPEAALACVRALAEAAGQAGMVGGQMRDIVSFRPTREDIVTLHAEKTGALFRVSAEMGARCGGASTSQRDALTRWGAAFGAAFQVRDDLLDAASSGGGDHEEQINIALRIGPEAARDLLAQHCIDALRCLDEPEVESEILRRLTYWVGEPVAAALASSDLNPQ